MIRIAIGVYGLSDWFDGDLAPAVELATIADRAGVDMISITDHVVMGEATDKYPYGRFPSPPDYPWFEPLTFLATVAGATRDIRLGTAVVIAPLRPAVLLAKQAATLDMLSRGRLDLGVGVGWQKEEYDATGLPFEQRYRILDETMRACRVLWSEAPARFHGEFVKFERIYSKPFPQQERLPLWFGLAPTPKNCARIAELGDGWIPIVQDPAVIKRGVAALREAFAARGRDPANLEVRAVPKYVFGSDQSPDLEATLAQLPALLDAGATVIELHPRVFCRGPDDFEAFVERLVALRQSTRNRS
jgi:probable F420-dependent oxidoreductase